MGARKPFNEMRYRRLDVWLTDNERETVERCSKYYNVTMSQFVRKCIAAGCEQMKTTEANANDDN